MREDLDAWSGGLLKDIIKAGTQWEVVLETLIFESAITSSARRALPHQRSLTTQLADGRRLTVPLYRGLGSSRIEGCSHNEFVVESPAQARSLRIANFRIAESQVSHAPVVEKVD